MIGQEAVGLKQRLVEDLIVGGGSGIKKIQLEHNEY